jgi:N-glycosylase/DNA lyase
MKRATVKPAPRIPRDGLTALYNGRRAEIAARLDDFAAVPRSGYFYELLYCLLTPQSSALNAGRVVEILRERGFLEEGFDPAPVLARKEHYIRFHTTKAARLLAVRTEFETISAHLSNGSTSPELREWLVANVSGLGWKEASHFLRNIGHRGLAILDRHILKNLVAAGVVRRLPNTLTPRRYLAIERKFTAFAREIGIPIDELDLLFWSMETGRILK